MKLEIREEPAKMIYIDDQLVGIFKRNGKLNLFKVEQVDYGNIEDVFGTAKSTIGAKEFTAGGVIFKDKT